MVALVTGAAGFLGSWISRRLADSGWRVEAAGRPEHELPSPEFDERLRDVRPDLVVHCAGPASVGASVADPASDFRGSVGVVHALLESLRALGSTQLVLISSAAVYGDAERLPMTEDDPLRPVSPYGFHRVACELLVREYHELWGVRACVLRVFSAYGEGLRRQIMWDVCAKALRDDAVELDGTGEESRDFVHAGDVARAVERVAAGAAFEAEAYNVGTGVETTTARLAHLLLHGLGLEREVRFSGRQRAGDPRRWRAQTDRIAALGFAPETRIEDGTRRYAEWARAELAR